MPLGYPAVRPLSLAVRRALSQRKGWGSGEQPFNPGLWNHATATASGGSQILGPNRYRIYSATGAVSQVTVPAVLVSGRAYRFQLTFETPVLGTQIQVGDAGANVDDFVSSLAGTRTVSFVADGTTATLKRPFVSSAGVPTDVVVKNVAITDITATALAITSQPVPRSVVAGSTTTFSVAVTAPFSAVFYQWEISTNGGSTWASYVEGSGAATNTLTTAALALADNGELFRCRIRMGNSTNTIGQIYSNAVALTVTAANANPVAPALNLGDLTVNTGVVKSSADLLAGATDANGDTLTITSVTAVSGGTVAGSGPWTITPSETGAGSLTVAISDGRGGSVNRTVTWNGVAANANPAVPSTVSLGAVSMGSTLVVSAAMLLAGATDADGDTLSVVSPTVSSGGATISGTGPWTITPTAAGPAVISYQISDGRGGTVNQTALLSVEAVTTYQRHLDFFGRFRNRVGNTTSYITVPAFTYAGGTDTVEIEFGAKLYSDEPYAAGTVEASILSRSSAGTGRDSIFKNTDGSVGIRSTGNVTLTISPAGTWALNEDARFRITDAPGGIQLHKMDSAGVYQHVQTTPRGTFNTLQPTMLMGNATRGMHGTLYYWAARKNGVQLYDFRLDEMAGDVFTSAHDSAVTATYVVGTNGFSVWRDETPESLAPQPDITVTGSLTQGSTLTITTSSLTFTGGMPQAQLYDDMVGRSGQVGTLATLGAWSSVKNPVASQTYKTGGPGGRPFVVWYDGPTGERVARVWQPGFGFSEFFASQQFRVPTDAAWSGTKTKVDGVTGDWTPVTGVIPDDSTLKMNWALSADDGGGTGSDIVAGSHLGGAIYKHAGNTLTSLSGATEPTGQIDLNAVMTWGEWMCQQHYIKHNATDQANGRHVMMWTGSKAKHRQSVSAGSVLSPSRSLAALNLVINGAWLDVNPLCRMEAAEIYLAAGTNAACRVVLGNSVRWDYCTKQAVCPPLTWAGQSLTARVGLGTLTPASETVYLFVVGSDGLPVNQYGKRVN